MFRFRFSQPVMTHPSHSPTEILKSLPLDKAFIACPSRFLRAVVTGDVTRLQQPKVPVFVYQQVKAKELKAVWQSEEAELAAHCLQALTCAATIYQENTTCHYVSTKGTVQSSEVPVSRHFRRQCSYEWSG